MKSLKTRKLGRNYVIDDGDRTKKSTEIGQIYYIPINSTKNEKLVLLLASAATPDGHERQRMAVNPNDSPLCPSLTLGHSGLVDECIVGLMLPLLRPP